MKRRINGEGSIYQRADGYWFVAVSDNGKQKVQSCGRGEDGRKKALTVLDGMKQEARKQYDYEHGLMPFGEYLAAFLRKKRTERSRKTKEPIRESSLIKYALVSAKHILPEIGNIPVMQLTQKDIQGVIDKMSDKGLASSYILQAYTVMRQALASAVPTMLDHNITVGVMLPSLRAKQSRRIFTDDEMKKFLSVVEKSRSRYKDVLYVYLDVGGRISEILGLQWACVGEDYIDINSTLSRSLKGIIDAPTKNRINRRVYLSKDIMQIIHRQPRTCQYVFPTLSGKPVEDRIFRAQWNVWLKKAFGADDNGKPLVHVTPHAVRHMQALNMFRSKWDLADVEARGGWRPGSRSCREIYLAHTDELRQRKMAKDAKKLRSK